MRRQRMRMAVATLLLAVGYVSALPLEDAQTGDGDVAFQIAEAFESIHDDNVTELLDEIMVPASLESESAVVLPEESPRDLRPIEVPTKEHNERYRPVNLPYGGALVAVEATALLVGGATIVVLLIAKAKSRSGVVQYDYDEDYIDPMLQSLLYSDMDYAAI
ncbi:hypothetical protein PHPALM_28566 [Phytophthora palmivora]|uniref:RxLR effector n=1 Tax=Phytophthora palmivora TaxID=4796 RepID=A0A2P4X9S4_9STRA|nr:hypothetical protein PHPALM_28566 [Phytophthora palmivora]